MPTLAAYRPAPKTGMPKDGLWIIAGLPKSGKSTLTASIEDSLLIEIEPGGADRINGRVQDVKDLAEFRGVLKLAVEDKSVKAIVVDSIDALSDMLEDEVAKKAGLSTMAERKAGVDGFALWSELRKKVESLVGYLKASNKLCILIGHYKEPKIDANGSLISPAGLQVPGKLSAYLAAQADAIGHSFKKNVSGSTQYFISFSGGPLGTWGSRIKELEDKTIGLPEDNPWSAIVDVFKPNEGGGK